jgi:aminoglycoside phosphotransferase (APT) family kinase protein
VPVRTPLALAALADAAVQGLVPVAVRDQPTAAKDLDSALVEDDTGRRWVVRSPRTTAAGARLEAEGRLLAVLAGWLPYSVPAVEGSAALPEGGRAVVHRTLAGEPVDLNALEPSSPLTAAIGRALATLHDVPERLVEDVGLPRSIVPRSAVTSRRPCCSAGSRRWRR